jgi:hypothetical protein
MFLARTVEDLLEHAEGQTEVIVVLDGLPADPPLPIDPRVRSVLLPRPIGQRAATNLAARLSEAKYVMKCDAHCAFDQGFDVKMMMDMQPDWTMVPKMYNLHVFDWVCDACGQRRYQGPSAACWQCGGQERREMIWRAKPSPETTAMRFDRDLKFQYWSGYKKRQTGDLVDTMSLLGACWMMEQERFWELGGCDEAHGSWGMMGTEIAAKTWLSGGRLVCTKKTWFSHAFRTQTGTDWAFPYRLTTADVARAQAHSKKLWLENTWPGAKHPLSWLIEKFAPVPDWDLPIGAETPSKALVYYTDNRLDPEIMFACQRQIEIGRNGHDLVTVSLQPILYGRNIMLDGERGPLTMFKQILAGLEATSADVVFLVEHDCMYHPTHFDFTPPRRDTFYYNQNRWQVDAKTGRALHYLANSTSGLCAYRELLLEHYRKRVKLVEERGFSRRLGFEPGTHNRPERVDDYGCDTWMSEWPNIDLRHGNNLTPTRWEKSQWRNQRYTAGWMEADAVPGWGRTKGRMNDFLDGVYDG